MIGLPPNRPVVTPVPTDVDSSRALPGEWFPTQLDAGRWRAALSEDAWPRSFPLDGLVWRSDVFAIADRWRSGGATSRQLLAATLMWAGGEFRAARRHAVVTLADDPFGSRLDAVLEPLRLEQLTSAELRGVYLAIRTDCRLRWLDSDATTRLLYFAGYRRGMLGVQPLLLDDEIASRIPMNAGVSSPANRGSSLEWIRWINWAAAQAGEECEPELVEMDLSSGGLRYGGGSAPSAGLLPRQVNRRWGVWASS
jgi:hypothetical protein